MVSQLVESPAVESVGGLAPFVSRTTSEAPAVDMWAEPSMPLKGAGNVAVEGEGDSHVGLENYASDATSETTMVATEDINNARIPVETSAIECSSHSDAASDDYSILRRFLRMAGLEDVFDVVRIHISGDLDVLLMTNDAEIRRLPTTRARQQRLIQALATERGHRRHSWSAENEDVLHSHSVLRSATAAERTSSRQNTPARGFPSNWSLVAVQTGREVEANEKPQTNTSNSEASWETSSASTAVPQRLALVPPGPVQADGCDEAGFFITEFEGMPDILTNTRVNGQAVAEAASGSWNPSGYDMQPQAVAEAVSSPWNPSGYEMQPASDSHVVRSLEPPVLDRQPSALTAAANPATLFLEGLARSTPSLLAESQIPSVLRPPTDRSYLSQDLSARPQTRRARIRELLRALEVQPCPWEVARVAARQQQAHDRHLSHRSRSPSSSSIAPPSSLSHPAGPVRRSRSLMDLIADPPGSYIATSAGPVPLEILDDIVARLPLVPVPPGRNEPCTICLECPQPGEMVTTLPCCHWYHRDCIREWLSHSQLCPLCKGPALPNNLQNT